MAHNAGHKLAVLSSICLLSITAFLITAVAVPQWLRYSALGDKPRYQGLFVGCENDGCSRNNFPANGQGVLGNLGCSQDGSLLQMRFQITIGTLLASACVTVVVAIIQCFHVSGKLNISPAVHTFFAFLLLLCFACGVAGVAVFADVKNSWWNCGSDYCQPYKSTQGRCEMGYGFFFAVAGTGLLLLCSLFVVTFAKLPFVVFPSADIVLCAALLEILAAVLIFVGVASPEWITVIYFYATIGLFQNCFAWSCDPSSLPNKSAMNIPTGCRSASDSVMDLDSRFKATAALLIVAAVLTLMLAITSVVRCCSAKRDVASTKFRKRIWIGLLGLALSLQVAGFATTVSTFQSCFCFFYTNYCRLGNSSAVCLAAIGLTVAVMIMHLFELNEWWFFQPRFVSGEAEFTFADVCPAISSLWAKKTPPTELPAPSDAAEIRDDDAFDDDEYEDVYSLPVNEDWEHDPISGFHWSDTFSLFYDPSSMKFFDPAKDEWFVDSARLMKVRQKKPKVEAAVPIHVADEYSVDDNVAAVSSRRSSMQQQRARGSSSELVTPASARRRDSEASTSRQRQSSVTQRNIDERVESLQQQQVTPVATTTTNSTPRVSFKLGPAPNPDNQHEPFALLSSRSAASTNAGSFAIQSARQTQPHPSSAVFRNPDKDLSASSHIALGRMSTDLSSPGASSSMGEHHSGRSSTSRTPATGVLTPEQIAQLSSKLPKKPPPPSPRAPAAASK